MTHYEQLTRTVQPIEAYPTLFWWIRFHCIERMKNELETNLIYLN